MKVSNPLAPTLMIASKTARRFYQAIDGQMTIRELIVEGHRVQVRLDQKGKPVAAFMAWPVGDQVRLARLAMASAWDAFARQAKSKSHVIRTDRSRETKRLRAEERATRDNEWLDAAYRAHPDFGDELLTQEARRIHALNRPEAPAKERNEITESYAKQFLYRKRNPPAT